MAGRSLPGYIEDEFEAYLKCGRLEEGFLRVRCEHCHAEKLLAFSCKKRGFCSSCGAMRMAETAALLADEVLPARPLRQWVLSLPIADSTACQATIPGDAGPGFHGMPGHRSTLSRAG
jgi:ribosomal protein S27E